MANFLIGGFTITPNIFSFNSGLASVSMPAVISSSSVLNQNQYAFMGGVLASNKLSIGLSNDILSFNGGYLAGRDVFQYQPTYNNPKLSIAFMGKFLGLPQADLDILLKEADTKKGNKVWLKNTLAWIGKNWTYILSGVVTAGSLIRESRTANSPLNTQLGYDPTTGTIPTTTGTGQVIIPTTAGGTGGISDILNGNIVPLAVLGLGLYFVTKK